MFDGTTGPLRLGPLVYEQIPLSALCRGLNNISTVLFQGFQIIIIVEWAPKPDSTD